MTRFPIRARVTAAFAASTALVLAATAAVAYHHVRADLDAEINAALHARADALAALARRSPMLSRPDPGTLDDRPGSFAQLLDRDGRLLDALGEQRAPALSGADARRARHGVVVVDRRNAVGEAPARILAEPVAGGRRAAVVVAGESLEARDEALGDLLAAVVAGGTLALLIASAIGYRVAGAGLAPLTALSRRAGDVSLRGDSAGFPLPAARDEVRRLGEALNDMLARLRRTSDRERGFVADAAGGMHMPIAVVRAELEGALRAGDCPPPVREALEAALAECERLTRFADDVLLAARSGEDALPPRRFTLDAGALLAGVRDDHAERARRAGRRIVVDAPAGAVVAGDPERLRQALGALVEHVLLHGDGDVGVRARTGGTGVELAVEDHVEDVRRAPRAARSRGRRAAREDAAGARPLALAREVAEAHGGHVTLVRGRGATVRIWLPAGGEAAGAPGAAARQGGTSPSHAPLG